MAAIDKMYTSSFKNYTDFKEWCLKQPLLTDKYGNKESISKYLIGCWEEDDFNDNSERPIFCAPYYVDAYVIRNCDLEFMQDEMKLHYNISYDEIKSGKVYSKPSSDVSYEPGIHFKCIKTPIDMKRNKPFMSRQWLVDVKPPKEIGFMWYHEDTDTWDFMEDYVISKWSSSNAFVRSISSLKRKIRKWKLPIGTKVILIGRYVGDEYEFVIKK